MTTRARAIHLKHQQQPLLCKSRIEAPTGALGIRLFIRLFKIRLNSPTWHPPLRHGLWRRPLWVWRPDQQGSSHMVPAAEAERGGEEPDHGLPEGEHWRKTYAGRRCRPSLALHHQSAQTQSSTVALKENALLEQVSLPLLLLLLLFLPLFHCDCVINNQSLDLFNVFMSCQ